MDKQELDKKYKQAVINGDSIEIANVCDLLLPDKLYNYSSFSEFWHSKIIQGKFFLNSPANFNDPYDCRVQDSVEFWLDETLKNYPEFNTPDIKQEFLEGKRLLNKDGRKITIEEYAEESGQELKRRFKIVCFSEVKDSLLMWSHYADMHKGYVIEIDTEKFKKDILEKYHFFKVIYDEKPITLYDMEKSRDKQTFLLFKSLEWAYEKEWRYIHYEKNFLDVSEYISAIYLGSRFDIKRYYFEFCAIQKHCQEKGIKLYQMKINDKYYKLDSVDITNVSFSADGRKI